MPPIKARTLLPEPTEENAYWSKHPHGIFRAMDELDPFHVTMDQFTFDLQCEKDFCYLP